MAQEYVIHTIDPGKEPFTDRNGNQWINVLFEGHLSSPIKWVMRPDSVSKYKVGDTVYGRLETPEGKNYQRFYKEQKPDGHGSNQASSHGPSGTSKYTPNPEQQESIARSVALKAAVDAFDSTSAVDVPTVLEVADQFLAWLQGSSESTARPTELTASEKTGYDKFKAKGQELKRDERDEYNDMRSQHDGEPMPEYQGE